MPKNWEILKLKDLCFQRTETIDPNKKGDLTFVGLEHIKSGQTWLILPKQRGEVRSTKFRFYQGDILYGKLRPYLDKTVISRFDGVCSTDLLVLYSKKESVLTSFLIYMLHSRKFINYAMATTTGTNHPRTSWKAISKFMLLLPPLPEQKKIAEILSTVDHAIEKANDAIKKIKELRKGLALKLFSQGIGHQKFKKTILGKIPCEWEIQKLDSLLELCQYGLSIKMDSSGKYPIIKMDNIINGRVIHEDLRYVNLNRKEFQKYKLEKGDILFNRTNSYELVGRTGVFTLEGDYVFASYLIRLRAMDKQISPYFLALYLIFKNDQLRQLATRAVHQANINATNLKGFSVLVPSLKEQKEITEIFNSIDQKMELLQTKKEKLERIKKGLMNDLLTGGKRVRVES